MILFLFAMAAAEMTLPELSRESQIALAAGAAPKPVADNAAIYVLEKSGYAKVREGTNGYACLVVRNHLLDRVPICHDANGVAANLQAALFQEKLRAAGKTEPEVQAAVAEGYRDGRFRAPKPGGISYMLSADGYTWNEKANRKDMIPPHVMVYAPYATNADLGIPEARLREIYSAGMPFVREPGTPGSFIIILTPHFKAHSGH